MTRRRTALKLYRELEKKKEGCMKLYMLTLSGQGDTYVKFMDEDVWEWIGDAKPGQKIPDTVEAKLKARAKREDDTYCPPNITSGSAENDAALQAQGSVYGKNKEASFYDMKSAMDFVKNHNVEILDTFEGYIY